MIGSCLGSEVAKMEDAKVLKLGLRLLLESSDIPEFIRPTGALFHRWLPDGRSDAILLTEKSATIQVSVWFERRARNQNGFLEWDSKGIDFDTAIMSRQYKLDAGILFGEVLISDITDAEQSAIRTHAIKIGEPFGQQFSADDAVYVALGRRLVNALHPPLSRFIDTLRTQYGQYWLRPVRPWDSRRQTLGSYCSNLALSWLNELSGDSFWFLPTNSGVTFTVQRKPMREEQEYLTEEDWRRLQREPVTEDASSAVQFLSLSHAAIANGNQRQAFVEAGTAIEFIVWHKLRRSGDPKSIESAIMGQLDRSPLTNLVAIALRLSGFAAADIELVLHAIAVRNRVVHDGDHPSRDEIDVLRHSLVVLAKLLGLPEFKQPILDAGNAMGPPDGARLRSGPE